MEQLTPEQAQIQQEQLIIQNLFDNVLMLAQCLKVFDFNIELTDADCRFEKEKIDVLVNEFTNMQTELRIFDLGETMKEMQHYSNIPLWFDPVKPENSILNLLASQFLSIPYVNLHTIIGTTLLDKGINTVPEQRRYFQMMLQIVSILKKSLDNIHNKDLIILNEVK